MTTLHVVNLIPSVCVTNSIISELPKVPKGGDNDLEKLFVLSHLPFVIYLL